MANQLVGLTVFLAALMAVGALASPATLDGDKGGPATKEECVECVQVLLAIVANDTELIEEFYDICDDPELSAGEKAECLAGVQAYIEFTQAAWEFRWTLEDICADEGSCQGTLGCGDEAARLAAKTTHTRKGGKPLRLRGIIRAHKAAKKSGISSH